MLQTALAALVVAALLYVALKRCAGLLLSAAAHNKHFKLTVESVGPLIVKGAHLQLAQGPVAGLLIDEVSLGHTRNASKTARAALSWQFRVPFTIRNLTVELRQRHAASKLADTRVSSAHKRSRPTSSSSPASATTKTLLNIGLRLVLGILPNIPIRVKQLTVKQANGILLDVPRVEVFINSSRLSSKLKVDIKLLPIRAVLQSMQGAGSDDVRLLELQHITSSVVLQVASQTLGLRCASAAVDVGPIVLTVTQALLTLLAATTAASQKPKERAKLPRKPARRLTVANFERIITALPDEVQVSVPAICIQASSLELHDSQLSCSLENRSLLMRAARQQPQAAPSSEAAAVAQPETAPIAADTEQLYWLAITSGGAHADLGMTNAVPAAAASINALSAELAVTRAVGLNNPSGVMAPANAANLHGSITFHDPSAVCCFDTLWPLAAEQQQQANLQLQQVLNIGGKPAEAAASQEMHMSPSETPHSAADPQASPLHGPHQAAAAAVVMSAGRQQQPARVPDQAASAQQQSASGNDEAASASAQQQCAGEHDQGASASVQQHSASGRDERASASAQQEPVMGLQWTMQAQTAGAATLEVLSGAGVLQLACGVDSAAVSARLQPGVAAGPAPAGLDASAQAAVKGFRVRLLTQGAVAIGVASPPQLQQLLVMHDLYLAGGAQSNDSKLLCKGNLNLDGLDLLLKPGMIYDLIMILEAAKPPKAFLNTSRKPRSNPVTDSSPPASKKKSRLALVFHELTVAVSNVNVAYQTALAVSAEDRLETGQLTLACTEHLAVQELTAEAFPSNMRASLQVSGLSLSHEEAPLISAPRNASSSPTAEAHTIQMLYASQLSLQAATASDMHTAQRTRSGHYVFATQEASASPVAAAPASAAGAGLPPFTVAITLDGLHPVFHADAVLALCQVAADMASVLQQTKPVYAPTQTPIPSADGNGTPIADTVTESCLSNQAADPPETPILRTAKGVRANVLPRVHAIIQLTQCQADFIVAENIVWGVSVPDLHFTLDSNSLIGLLQKQQQQQQHIRAPGLQPAQQHGPGSESAPAAVAEALPGVAMTELFMPDQASRLEAERPRLQLREAVVTLNSKLLLYCGLLDVDLDLFPGLNGQFSAGSHCHTALASKPSRSDWDLPLEQHAAAYAHAKLPAWAQSCLSTDPPSHASQPSANSAAQDPQHSIADSARPASVAEVSVSDVRMNLPHDQDFGRAERFVELWAKAFQKVLKGYLSALNKKANRPAKAKQAAAKLDTQALLLPIELRLSLRGGTVKFEHHPLEAWFAVHGPLLRGMAAQDALWSRVVAADLPASDDLARSGSQELAPEQFVQEFSSEDRTQPQTDQATSHALSVERSRQYFAACEQLQNEGREDSSQGALMHVAAEVVLARIVLMPTDAASTAAALHFMAEVDPPSKGVPMRQVQKLHVDASVQDVVVRFCGNSQPLAQAASARFSGAIAVGRQVTAPPLLYKRRMQVGRHRQTEIGVTVKGSRALVKVYTDVQLDVDQAQACYGNGLEPAIAMVSQAGKRLSPTDPDKTRPKPAALPWFDMMRFMWRGGIGIHATNFEFTLATEAVPDVTASTQRLLVQAAAATVQLAYGGKLVVTTAGLIAQAFKAAGLDQPAGTMFALPLLDFPHGHYVMSAQWHLASGRGNDDHHLFPVPVPEGPDACQGPMLPADHFKTQAVDIDLQIAVGNEHAVQSVVGPQAQATPVAESQYVMDGSAILFMGDHQVVFMKDMIALLSRPPLWLKAPLRHGTYFLAVDKRRVPTKNLPKLFDHFNIKARAGPLDVVHYTVDAEDPSNGLCLSMASGAWQGNMLMNQPNPQPAHPGASVAEQKRQAARVRTQMLSMLVQTHRVQLTSGEPEEQEDEAETTSQDKLLQLMSAERSSSRQLQSQPSLRGLLTTPQSPDDFILYIESATVTQSSAEPGQKQGPTKVQINNCQLLVDVSTRNAVWGAAMHLFHAFRPLPAPVTPQVLGAAAESHDSHVAAPSPRDARARGKSTRSLLRPQPSFGQQGGDLMAILNQQNQQAQEEDEESLPDEATEAEEPIQRHFPDEAVPAEEPVAQAEVHLVGKADGAPTDGHDQELHHALAAETEHKEEVKAAQAKKAATEHSSSRLTFEVEVVHFQAYLQAELVPGRFLLAAERGRVEGRSLADAMQNVTEVTLDQVQAHVAQTEVDPGAAVVWLQPSGQGMQAPSAGTQVIRRVFDPFKVQLGISKFSSSQATGQGTSPSRVSQGNGTAKAGTSTAAPGSQGQEIRLTVPQIGAVMDSKEFEVLTDVISNVGTAQGPHVESVIQDRRLALPDPAGETVEIEAARQTFAYLRQYLLSLEAEAHKARTEPLLASTPSRNARSESGGKELLRHLSRHHSDESVIDELADIPSALHYYFHTLKRFHSDQSHHDRLTMQGENLVMRWSQEQSQAAAHSLQAARDALLEVMAQAQKQKQNLNAKRFTLELEAIRFHLCQDNGVLTQVRAPFVEASIQGVMLDSMQNKDLSGSSKLVIQRLDIKDTLGLVGEAPGLPQGMIVSAWNPDEGWERDALLRVNATKGVPTADLTIWQLVDVMVHPLGVHIVQHVANSLWEYFFPKEDAAAKQRQQQWVKTVASRRKAATAGMSNTSRSGLNASGNSMGSASSTAAAAERAVAAVGASQPTSPTSPVSPVFALGRRSRHRRISSWDQTEASKGRSFTSNGSGPMSPANSGDLTVNRPKASSSVFRRPLRQRSASFEELSAAPWAGSGGSAKSAPSAPKAAAAPKPVVKQHKLLFVHFQINRVHCRVTYTGAPFNIKDFKVLLDKQVYEGLEGRWVDLFNRMKWDIIKSVLKSVAGLQGRKFKELLPDHLLKEAKAAADRTKGAKVQWPFGWGKKKEPDQEPAPAPDAESLKARQKKRMMFGDQHLARFGSMTARQGADLSQPAADQPIPAEQELHPQASSSAPVDSSATATQRGKAFMTKAFANTTQGFKAFTAPRTQGPPLKESPTRAIPNPESGPQSQGSPLKESPTWVIHNPESGPQSQASSLEAGQVGEVRRKSSSSNAADLFQADLELSSSQPQEAGLKLADSEAEMRVRGSAPESTDRTLLPPAQHVRASHDDTVDASASQHGLAVSQPRAIASAQLPEPGEDGQQLPLEQSFRDQLPRQNSSDPGGAAQRNMDEVQAPVDARQQPEAHQAAAPTVARAPAASSQSLSVVSDQEAEQPQQQQYSRQLSGNPFQLSIVADTFQAPAPALDQAPLAQVPLGQAPLEQSQASDLPLSVALASLPSADQTSSVTFVSQPQNASAAHMQEPSRQSSGPDVMGTASPLTASSLADMLGSLHPAGSTAPRASGNPFANDSDEEDRDALQPGSSYSQAPAAAPESAELTHAMPPVPVHLQQLQTEQQARHQHQHQAQQPQLQPRPQPQLQQQPDLAETERATPAAMPVPASLQPESRLRSTGLQHQPAMAAHRPHEGHPDWDAAFSSNPSQAALSQASGTASPPPSPFASSQAEMPSPPNFHQVRPESNQFDENVLEAGRSAQLSRRESAHTEPSGRGSGSALLPTASTAAPTPQTAQPWQYQPQQEQSGAARLAKLGPQHAVPQQGKVEPSLPATAPVAAHHFPPAPSWQPRQADKQVLEVRSELSNPYTQMPNQASLHSQPGVALGEQQSDSQQQPQLQSRAVAAARPELGSGFSPLRQAAPRLGSEPTPLSGPQSASQLVQAHPGPSSALQAMLGSSAPDAAEEAAGSDVSAQDRMQFMQSLQSPGRAVRGNTFAKGFGRMKARARDMLQAGAQSVNAPAGQPSASQGAREGDQTGPDAGLSRGGKMARDMSMMLAGLKRPNNQ